VPERVRNEDPGSSSDTCCFILKMFTKVRKKIALFFEKIMLEKSGRHPQSRKNK